MVRAKVVLLQLQANRENPYLFTPLPVGETAPIYDSTSDATSLLILDA